MKLIFIFLLFISLQSLKADSVNEPDRKCMETVDKCYVALKKEREHSTKQGELIELHEKNAGELEARNKELESQNSIWKITSSVLSVIGLLFLL